MMKLIIHRKESYSKFERKPFLTINSIGLFSLSHPELEGQEKATVLLMQDGLEPENWFVAFNVASDSAIPMRKSKKGRHFGFNSQKLGKTFRNSLKVTHKGSIRMHIAAKPETFSLGTEAGTVTCMMYAIITKSLITLEKN
jgi:hypothetical protein